MPPSWCSRPDLLVESRFCGPTLNPRPDFCSIHRAEPESGLISGPKAKLHFRLPPPPPQGGGVWGCGGFPPAGAPPPPPSLPSSPMPRDLRISQTCITHYPGALALSTGPRRGDAAQGGVFVGTRCISSLRWAPRHVIPDVAARGRGSVQPRGKPPLLGESSFHFSSRHLCRASGFVMDGSVGSPHHKKKCLSPVCRNRPDEGRLQRGSGADPP
jgi:hypothetical protein